MPKVLRLISLEALDLQDAGVFDFDKLRFIVVLDGHPARRIGWDQRLHTIKEFTDDENLTDEEWTGGTTPFVFWSTADITVYESDPEGLPILDDDPDEWIQTVRLDHREADENPVEIGKLSLLTHLAPGRSDCRYRLTYVIQNHNVTYDERLSEQLAISHASEFVGLGQTTGDFEFDKGNCRWICAIDGGGLRGVFALRVLEQMEHYYGRSCLEMFDMFAGTSTGALIAGGLASGRPLQEIITLYCGDDTRQKIFQENTKGQHHAFRYLDFKRVTKEGQDESNIDNAKYIAYFADRVQIYQGALNGLLNRAAEQLMTPRYRKTGLKEILYQVFSTRRGSRLVPITLRECQRDILITARDLNRNETTLFSAFHIPYTNSAGVVTDVVTGVYRDVFLKDAAEASASPPVYFAPRARFTDGGVGPYNNPCFIGAFEALNRSHIDLSEEPLTLEPKYTEYSEVGGVKSGTVVWSLGTTYPFIEPDQRANTARLIGGSLALNARTDTALYWVGEVIDNLMFGASQEQVFLCREYFGEQIKLVRINLGLNQSTLFTLDIDADYGQTLAAIKVDAHTPADFALMDRVAKRFALYVRDRDFGFDEGGYELPDPTLDVPGQKSYATSVKLEFETYE